jgi:DnaJ-class molecular chaperone
MRETKCLTCGGTGKVGARTCSVCRGLGKAVQNLSNKVKEIG